jgi:hypothetical protein
VDISKHTKQLYFLFGFSSLQLIADHSFALENLIFVFLVDFAVEMRFSWKLVVRCLPFHGISSFPEKLGIEINCYLISCHFVSFVFWRII